MFMNKEQGIREGNKLIAVFMGGRSLYPFPEGFIGYVDGLPNGSNYFEITAAKYHSSWDWLMPVVEKIESMDSRGIDCRIEILKKDCNIYYADSFKQYDFTITGSSKIDAVYNSVITFLTWLNNQKTESVITI